MTLREAQQQREELSFLVDVHARFGSRTMVAVSSEIALIDAYIAKQQAMSGKLTASAVSACVVAGQWLFSDKGFEEDLEGSAASDDTQLAQKRLLVGMVVGGAAAFLAVGVCAHMCCSRKAEVPHDGSREAGYAKVARQSVSPSRAGRRAAQRGGSGKGRAGTSGRGNKGQFSYRR